MPWYPHPDDGYVAGFWDGRQWSIAQAEHHLMVDGKWIAFDDIIEVSYRSETVHSGWNPGIAHTPACIERRFTLTDRSGNCTSLDLGVASLADDPELRAAWEGLVDISRKVLEPRIAQRILGSLRAGEEYEIRHAWTCITLSRSGFRGRAVWRERKWSWSDYATTDVNPHLNNLAPFKNTGQVRIWAKSGSRNNKLQIVTGFKTSLPNAVVLGTLLPMCAAEFGSGAPISGS